MTCLKNMKDISKRLCVNHVLTKPRPTITSTRELNSSTTIPNDRQAVQMFREQSNALLFKFLLKEDQ